MTFSIIMPMDTNRLPLWKKTMAKYEEFGIPETTEFIIPTRSKAVVDEVALSPWAKQCKTVLYTHELGYNPSKALNLGVLNSKHEQIIITSPEVMPTTNVLRQLNESLSSNIVCEVWDEDVNGNLAYSLVNKNFRGDHPGMYFLAMFQKKDIEAINGWDEEFMKGYAWEDPDFGFRWNRAKLPFVVREDILARHQYHERPETIPGGFTINQLQMERNNKEGVIKPKNGLYKL